MNQFLNNRYVVTGLAVVALGSVAWTWRKQLGRTLAPRLAAIQRPGSAPAPAHAGSPAPAFVSLPDADLPANARPTIRRDLAKARTPRWVDSPERDPFALITTPVVAATSQAPKNFTPVKISAIWRQAGQHLAVINGKLVREGDETVEHYVVDRIEGGAVFLRRGDTAVQRAEFPGFAQFTNHLADMLAPMVPSAPAEADRRRAPQPGG